MAESGDKENQSLQEMQVEQDDASMSQKAVQPEKMLKGSPEKLKTSPQKKKKKKNTPKKQISDSTEKETPTEGGAAAANTEGEGAREVEGHEASTELSKAAESVEEIGDAEVLNLGNLADLDGPGRNRLFERGRQYEDNGKAQLALKCYLGCLTGLEEGSGFTYLPQCLHSVADVYFKKEEYEKAIQFIQAEKMYYESALIDTMGLEKRVEDRKKEKESGDTSPPVTGEESLDALRATEYEELSKLCLERDQPRLALDYIAKATKLRQQVFGEQHPITVKSLDFFTVVYAEVGKQQYKESLQKHTDRAVSPGEGGDAHSTPISEPASILRRRKFTTDSDLAEKLKKEVSFEEMRRRDKEDEEWISMTLLWIFLGVLSIMLVVLLTTLYCSLTERSSTCSAIKGNIYYAYMKIKYTYHYYTSTKDFHMEPPDRYQS
ncbi:uncharacterized protein LOC106155754 isoform X1 [Lingula anatina]|uniref:Uncharacterized protein LOC106155754 isoform X1 n=1 Tax=Lingula anatina TaxID=7574 RepID=A0A1S3HL54_LINAN|nr:uncharacterized protein LOC106155754 isoform X1 [Lingula anatina]|eukprot:XP_013386191.1 uncharacterized protein LOC106155754 isoform X1 [Lingula anatina]